MRLQLQHVVAGHPIVDAGIVGENLHLMEVQLLSGFHEPEPCVFHEIAPVDAFPETQEFALKYGFLDLGLYQDLEVRMQLFHHEVSVIQARQRLQSGVRQ